MTLLLGLMLAVCPALAETNLPETTLWLATPQGVVVIEPATGLRLEIPATADARAVAVDAKRGSVWVATDNSLSRFDLAGRLLWRQELSVAKSEAQMLQVVPEDGSAWLARGDQLESFGAGGQSLQKVTLNSPVRGLMFDPERSELWVATANGLTARDAIAGYPVRSLETTSTGASGDPQSLSLDSGHMWLVSGERLMRFDVEGARILERETAASAVLSDGHSGVWTVDKTRLILLDAQGEEVIVYQPFGEEGEVAAWEFDPATRSLWITDGHELVRISASGWELDRHLLADHEDALRVFDFAMLSVVDTEPPVVEILTPADGSIAKGRARLEVKYRDDRSGVRSGSLRVTANGVPVDAQCVARADGASCQLPGLPVDRAVRLVVTVADEMGNESEPAAVGFKVETPRKDGEEGSDADSSGESDLKLPFDQPAYTPVVTPRGFRPNTPFLSASEIDHVDTASGNLVVTIPLGQTYQVGPILEYQVRPVYNSNLWQHIEVGCPVGGCSPPHTPITFASTNYAANAGLGWELHFGRLYAPIAPSGLPSFDWKRWPNRPTDVADLNDRWMYVAPSGAVTYLHSLPGRNNGTPSLPVRYSKGGEFTRMRQKSSTEIEVQMPNGLVSVFHRTGAKEGTEFCGDGVSGCWRLYETKDPYGNYMRVTYNLNASIETWTIRDSTGRQHTVTLSHGDGDTAGGDGSPPYWTPDRDEWGDLRKVVKKVQLAVFGSSPATYDFTYATRTLQRGSPHDGHLLPPAVNTIRTRVLSQITVPHSRPWQFTTYTTSNPHYNGRLIEVTAPAQGRIAWEYSNIHWDVPTRCTYSNNVDPAAIEFDYRYTGVRRRISKLPNGTVEGIWTYESQLNPGHSSMVLYGPFCRRADYRKTTVNAPPDENGKHTRTVYYNSVAQGPRFPNSSISIDNWQVTDGGLPFAKNFTTGSSTSTRRFLSRQTFHCTGGACGGAKRSTYVRYATEYRNQCNKSLGDSAGCYQSNPLLVAERTVFNDDGSRYIDVEHLDYNGAGSFRRTVTKDNFSGNNTRTDTTNYTATGTTVRGISGTTGYISIGTPSTYLPSPASKWILHPYSKQTATEGGRTYVTEFQFNGNGSMTCSRRWKSPGGRGGKDLVVKLGIGSQAGNDNGLPVSETVAGGEWASLSTSSSCATNGSPSNGSSYLIRHNYQHLQLARTYISGFPDWYRATIDRDTGLPSVTYNAADQSTSHQYDQLGRLTRSTPTASLGQTRTEIVYRNPAGGNPSIETLSKSTSGATLTKEIQVYDHFARPIRNIMRRPAGDSSYTETEQKTFYNALGWVAKATTRQNKSSVNTSLATRYTNYDAFGRVGKITAPDGQVENRTYSGVRVSRSTVQVRTSVGGTTSVTTTTSADSRGRTVQINNPLHNTRFTFDPYDAQISARRTGSGIDQTRLYDYDARGLLIRERHPEIGTSGNGYATYKPDAFGNRRTLQDAGRNLTYVYDNSGRLIEIKNTSGGRSWRRWVWGTANNGSDYRKGKVIREIRHNYPYGGADDWSIYEEYEYRGKLGKTSKKTTQLQHLNRPGADRYNVFFSQTFEYDQLGNTTRYGYPTCETTPQNGRRLCDDGPNDVLAPAHSVTVTYNQGKTRRVSSGLGPWGEYNYHHNLQMSRLDYSNTVDGIFDQGTNGMVRPQRMRYSVGVTARFDTGSFSYDGAGNVWAIGNDRYTYDQASRLLSGTVSHAGPGFKKEFTYDAADNIGSFRQNSGPWSTYQVNTGTNRMQNGLGFAIQYDGSGNLTRVGSPAVFAMEYDALNQQAQFDNYVPGQESIHLHAFGPGEFRLITFDGHTAERTFKLRDLSGRVLREYKVNGWGPYVDANQQGEAWTFEKDFIYGPSGLIATRAQDGSELFFHQDHLGTTRAITNNLGVKVGTRNYYPFGEAVSNNSGADEPTVKFAGHERDAHNLADYMLARTYFFPFGRFASTDPAGDGWNRYAYVGNNPINVVDPDGRFGLGVAKKLLKLAIKGGDVAATFAGAIADFNTVTNANASFGDRLTAGLSLATEIASPISARDAKAGIAAGRKVAGEASDGIVKLWKAPQRGRTGAAQEVVDGYDPSRYPGDGPFFSRDKGTAQKYQYHYENGLQEINVPRSEYDRLTTEGVIRRDGLENQSVHVPATGLEAFNEAIKSGPSNRYHLQ